MCFFFQRLYFILKQNHSCIEEMGGWLEDEWRGEDFDGRETKCNNWIHYWGQLFLRRVSSSAILLINGWKILRSAYVCNSMMIRAHVTWFWFGGVVTIYGSFLWVEEGYNLCWWCHGSWECMNCAFGILVGRYKI